MANAIQKMRQGHAAAAARSQDAARAEGARPLQAVAEALAAAATLAAMGKWPGPRDPVSERSVEEVRRRWAQIEHRAQEARRR